MPMNKRDYPETWPEISRQAKERAGNKCQQCGLPNGATILRSVVDGARYLILKDDGIYYTPDGQPVRLSDMPEEFADQERDTVVVLTVHHIGIANPDGTPGSTHNKFDCRPENLAALCQRCHLLADMATHVRRRKETMAKRKRAAGQLELL